MNFSTFKSEKNLHVQLMSFHYINIETTGKWKNESFLSNPKKNVQVQLKSFGYINAETKKKWIFPPSNLKKFTSPANEFPLHKYRNKQENKKINLSFQIKKNV